MTPPSDLEPLGTLVAVTPNPDVDAYIEGAQRWPDEIRALRSVLARCGLTEELKWAKPCYSHDGRNIVIVQEMKAFLALMFFKGALLSDPDGVLEEQGPNSRSARRILLTSVGDVERLSGTIEAYIDEATALEAAGLEVAATPELVLAEELQRRIDADPSFKTAFQALTPGRQREYHLFVTAAKQSSTRVARVERCEPRILDGKGLRDR